MRMCLLVDVINPSDADSAHQPVGQPADASAFAAAAALLRTLGNEHRLAIVLLIRDAPRCVHELVDALSLSQPLVSQHLRVLRSSGLVQGERRGREIAYSLADDHVAHIVGDAVVHATERNHP
jgi:ArsR family transcriptional regulator, zinc-responsive transcriptional repressor